VAGTAERRRETDERRRRPALAARQDGGSRSRLCGCRSEPARQGAPAPSRSCQECHDSSAPANATARGRGCFPTCCPARPELSAGTRCQALGPAAPNPRTASSSAAPLTRSQRVPEGHQALLNTARGFELCSPEGTGATKFSFRITRVQDISLNCLLENRVVIQAINEKSAHLTA